MDGQYDDTHIGLVIEGDRVVAIKPPKVDDPHVGLVIEGDEVKAVITDPC